MQTWRDDDFEALSWHDCTVHGMHDFPDTAELRFDLDFITRWVQPLAPKTHFTFWLAPATLSFHKAHGLHIELGPPDFGTFVILSVQRATTKHAGVYDFDIRTLGGGMRFRASAVTQHLRAAPIHHTERYLELDARGGISFAIPVEDDRDLGR